MNSFPNRLRMNQIFPTDGFNPLGPPSDEGFNIDEMSRIQNRIEPILMRRKKADQDHQINMLRMQQQGQLGNIANQALNKNPVGPTKPMDVIYQPNDPLAMKHRELNLKEKELKQRGDIAYRGLDIKQGDSDIRQQIANLRIPESEKLALMQKYGLQKIDATGQQNRLTEGVRQDGREQLLDTRGEQNKVIQGVKGQQQLTNIAAQVAGRTGINDASIQGRVDAAKIKADAELNKPMIPTQARVAENLAARQLINTRPELAKFIQQDTNGNFTVVESGDPAIDALIKNSLYPSKDIKLPSDTKKTESKKIETKPKSKYAVTIK